MQTNFSVYTRDPIPKQESKKSTMYQRPVKSSREETPLAKKIRKDMYANDPEAAKEVHKLRVSAAQKKKIARDQVLSTLIGTNLIDQKRIVDNLIEYAIQNEDVSEQRAKAIYGKTLITTESDPSKSVFKIRIKL